MLELKREEIQLKELHSHLSKRLRRHSCNRKKMLFIHHSSGHNYYRFSPALWGALVRKVVVQLLEKGQLEAR